MKLKKSVTLMAAMALGVIVAGCGAGATTTTTGDSTLDPSGTLTFAEAGCEDSFDPGAAHGLPKTTPLTLSYDSLIGLTPDLKLVPDLATKWTWTNPKTLRLNLRTGVKFHDGSAFDADVVVANFQRMQKPDAGDLTSETAAFVDKVTAVDPQTVDITLKQPASSFLAELTGPGGMMISQKGLQASDIATHDYGSGMYTLGSITPNAKYVFNRFDGYWDPKAAAAKQFVFLCTPESATRLNALRSHETDLTLLDPNQVAPAKAAGLQVDQVNTVSIFTVFMNNSRPALKNPQVRQAINFAIDRTSIVKSLEFGLGQPTPQFVGPDSNVYDPQFGMDYYQYDPDKAKSMLQQAGFGNGVTLQMLVVNRPEDTKIAAALQQMLAKANVTLNLKVIDGAQAGIYVKGQGDMLLGRWGGRVDPLVTLDSQYRKGYNPGGGSTPQILAALSKAQSTTDESANTATLKQISGLGAQAGLSAPLFALTVPYVSDGCVVGFKPSQLVGVNSFRGVGVSQSCQR